MVVAAFSGLAIAQDPVDVPTANPRAVINYIPPSGAVEMCDAVNAFGNCTFYTPGQVSDIARTPEMYGGYGAGSANHGIYDSAPNDYIFTDFGSKLADWTAGDPYNAIYEVTPLFSVAAGTTCYVTSSGQAWAGDPDFWADADPLEPLADDIAVTPAGVLTWTDLVDTANNVANYRVFKNGAFLINVAPGVETYTDGAAAPGDAYYIKVQWEGGYNGYSYSPTVTIPVAGGDPPVTAVTSVGAYRNTATFDITYSGSDVDGDWASTELFGAYDGAAYGSEDTDLVDGTFTASGPYADGEWEFYTIGTDAVPNVEAAPGTPDWTVIVDTLDPVGVITNGPAAPTDTIPFALTYTYADDTAVSTNVAGTSTVDLYVWTPLSGGWVFDKTDASVDGAIGYTPTDGLGDYEFFVVETDAAGNANALPVVLGQSQWTVTYADLGAPAVANSSPGTAPPNTAFDITAVVSDAQTLVLGSVVLYYIPTTGGPIQGPIAADSAVNAPIDNINSIPGVEAENILTYTWNFPAGQPVGLFEYYFDADDGIGNTVTDPAGAVLPGGGHSLLVQVAGNNPQPHPVIGYVLDPLGIGLVGATVDVTWFNGGVWYTNSTVSGTDGIGNDGWYQIDLAPNNYTAGDPLYVNATYLIAGVPYTGTNYTVVQAGDNILPDDDKEYMNVTIIIEEFFELKWTLGWNIWSHPMLRSENASLGMTDLKFHWFGEAHLNDTMVDAAFSDNCTLVAWNGAAYITYVHPLDWGGANDVVVTPDLGYWAYVEESWFTDEVTLSIAEQGIMVPGQYVWRHVANRAVAVNAGWNLLGWTSFNTTYAATDVIKTLTTGAVSGDGVPQPEIIANWTAWTWEVAAVADMQHYEAGKDYTTYVWLGTYGESVATYDFPIAPGYGFWVYSEVGGQTLNYNTA
jgi:hypothetical protein